jgi:hypothetical protein
MMHSVSIGYTPNEYSDWIGWEEGVVEQMQRLHRQEILQTLQVKYDQTSLAQIDSKWLMNPYIGALEEVRDVLKDSEASFYGNLLATPLRDRYTHLLMRARGLPLETRKDALLVLSRVNRVLKE